MPHTGSARPARPSRVARGLALLRRPPLRQCLGQQAAAARRFFLTVGGPIVGTRTVPVRTKDQSTTGRKQSNKTLPLLHDLALGKELRIGAIGRCDEVATPQVMRSDVRPRRPRPRPAYTVVGGGPEPCSAALMLPGGPCGC
eukprot:COSAG01_NODE_1336_length_10676_cov_7.741420_3_plen_142_part_00